MTKERRLGRGLEALLGRSFGAEVASIDASPTPVSYGDVNEPASPTYSAAANDPEVTRSEDGQQWLPVAGIERNAYQPRTNFDEAELADLCDSIRTHGFLQPIVVRRTGSGHQLIAGERRLRAAQMAGWERVPVQIRDVTDRQMAELAIVENVQRKDLNPIEKAGSFHRYLSEYNCTQEELASRINVDRSTIANLVRLLELPEEVKTMVSRGDLSAGHARALLPIGDEQEQVDFARRIRRDSMSVRATEQAVIDHIRRADLSPLSVIDAEGNSRRAPLQPGQHLRDMEDQLRHALGAKVEIKQTAKGRGRITIHFATNEEFERLQAALSQPAAAASGDTAIERSASAS